MNNNELPAYEIQPNPKHINQCGKQVAGMTEHCGKSGWIKHGNNYEPHLGSKYGHQLCNQPTLLNKDNSDVSLDTCIAQCQNDPNCTYLSHATVKGDKNRDCNPVWKDYNFNRSYPTGRPCIPKAGKQNCDICKMYKVNNVPGTNIKSRIKLTANDQFTTYVKKN